MANDRISMPQSGAGITRYFDDYKSKVTLKPGHIIILCIVVLVIMVLLHTFGSGLLGIGG